MERKLQQEKSLALRRLWRSDCRGNPEDEPGIAASLGPLENEDRRQLRTALDCGEPAESRWIGGRRPAEERRWGT